MEVYSWENHRNTTLRKWRFGDLASGFYVYIANWKITMLFSWVNRLFRLGHFQVRKLLVYQAGYGIFLITRIKKYSLLHSYPKLSHSYPQWHILLVKLSLSLAKPLKSPQSGAIAKALLGPTALLAGDGSGKKNGRTPWDTSKNDIKMIFISYLRYLHTFEILGLYPWFFDP